MMAASFAGAFCNKGQVTIDMGGNLFDAQTNCFFVNTADVTRGDAALYLGLQKEIVKTHVTVDEDSDEYAILPTGPEILKMGRTIIPLRRQDNRHAHV